MLVYSFKNKRSSILYFTRCGLFWITLCDIHKWEDSKMDFERFTYPISNVQSSFLLFNINKTENFGLTQHLFASKRRFNSALVLFASYSSSVMWIMLFVVWINKPALVWEYQNSIVNTLHLNYSLNRCTSPMKNNDTFYNNAPYSKIDYIWLI